MKRLASLLLLGSLGACTHSIHLNHVGAFEPDLPKGERIEHTEQQFVVLYFAFDNDYIDKGLVNFKSKCADGVIHGITTRVSTSHSFLSWTNKVRYEGICVKS